MDASLPTGKEIGALRWTAAYQRKGKPARACGLDPLMDYARPDLLLIDEVGYLSYSNRHADLLFELISRRYQNKSTVVTTNKSFGQWHEVFPNASCVVSLTDRLVHRCEVVAIEGESYRLKEAKERTAQKAAARASAGRKASKK